MTIAMHGAHDASISFVDKQGIIRIFEIERFCKIRSAALSPAFNNTFDVIDKDSYIKLLHFIKSESGYNQFDTCLYNQIFDEDFNIIQQILGIKTFVKTNHHRGHAKCAYHQSNFDDCLIFSFDGGGHDEYDKLSFFNVYTMINNHLEHIKQIDINFGTAYALIGVPISEIRKNKNINNYAGKLMGLSGYGKINQNWVENFKQYYLNTNLTQLFDQLNLSSHENDISGQVSYDLAKTSQYVFETLFLENFLPIYKQYNLPVCLTGGCALNVLNNQIIKNIVGGKNIYIPPNPNDAGLSFGYLLDKTPLNEEKHNITFNGFDFINKDIIDKIDKKQPLNLNTICNYLSNNKIIGVVRGYSECGPRALGNRSLLCYPMQLNLKEILNANIKFREWFRPFAAAVRKKDVSRYFEDIDESKYMSFCPKIKSEYKSQLPSIVHIDDTCRIQTVTEDDEFLYNLLTNMELYGLEPILLNTSFNIKGKPLVNDVHDVIEIYNTVPIDGIVLDNYMLLR
jgi:carbamoyltransferase